MLDSLYNVYFLIKIYLCCCQNSELMDKLTAAETEAAELKNLVDDLEYDCVVILSRTLS